MLTLLTFLACGDKSTEDTAKEEVVEEQLDSGAEDTAE